MFLEFNSANVKETDGKRNFRLFAVNGKWKWQTSVCLLQTENGNGKLPFVCCKQKMETANFRLFTANGNGKWKFCYPWSANNKR
jgi:hypothetical protein